jgi:hypothetical protein
MLTYPPRALLLSLEEETFLLQLAANVLANSSVAVTTTAHIARRGFDPEQVDRLLPATAHGFEIEGVLFKKIPADKSEPDNFGLVVRRLDGS